MSDVRHSQAENAGDARGSGGTDPSRWLPMQGCVNFRDLGGYRNGEGQTVRWRRLFRSDALQDMTPADTTLAVEELNIGLVVDLRNTNEAERDGRGLLAQSEAGYRHFPLLDARGAIPPFTGGDIAERLTSTYQWLVRNSGSGVAEAIRSITETLDDGKGAVFHCSAGKDRTGLLAAMILEVLGVDQDTISADYMLTHDVVDGIVRRIRVIEQNSSPTAQTLAPQPLAFRAYQETLREEYGGAEAYLLRHGLTNEAFDSLRRNLLE